MFRFFFSAVLIIYIPIILYLGYRLWQVVNYFIPSANKIAYWLLYLLLSLSFVLTRSVGRVLPDAISEVIESLGYYWLIGSMYLFMILIFLDIILLLSRLTKAPLPLRFTAPFRGITAIILVILILLYGSWNALNPRVINYNLEIPKKAGNIKELQVVMVSDLHLSKVVHNGRLKEMVDKINTLNPDLVLMPGDLIQRCPVFC